MRRNITDRLVEVLDFHRVERNVDHIAIGVHPGHFDPVADPQHILRGQLHAGDKAKDRILEHQQQHRRDRAKAGQQQQRRLVNQDGDDDDRRARQHKDFEDLEIPLDRAVARFGAALVHLVGVGQRLDDRHRHRQRDQRARCARDKGVHAARQVRHQHNAVGQHQQRGDGRQPCGGFVDRLALTIKDRRGGAQDDPLQDEIDDCRDQKQHGQADKRLRPRLLFGEENEQIVHSVCGATSACTSQVRIGLDKATALALARSP